MSRPGVQAQVAMHFIDDGASCRGAAKSVKMTGLIGDSQLVNGAGKVAKRTYSIRTGFEYQDLACAVRMAELIVARAWTTHFEIESDEVHHVDDLVITSPGGEQCGYQVKFHVNRAHAETFATFTEKPRPKSRSLLEKLFRGWGELSNDGEFACRIEFISSAFVDTGEHELGEVIDTKTDIIGERFFDESAYKDARNEWKGQTTDDDEKFRAFVQSITWTVGYESVSRLRLQLSRLLTQAGLPSHETALRAFESLIQTFALKVRGKTPVAGFVQKLWEFPEFRESCEQRFPDVNFASGAKVRARTVRVASVALQLVPAFLCDDFACLEEPVFLGNYKHGITGRLLTGTFDEQRKNWFSEYEGWNRARIMAVLELLEPHSPDIILFPRFAVSFPLATEIYQWAIEHDTNVFLGGVPMAYADQGLDDIANTLNAKLYSDAEEPLESWLLNADVVIRARRAGRASLSQLSSPYAKKEEVKTDIITLNVLCREGWIEAVALSSTAAIGAYIGTGRQTPELILISTGIHPDSLFGALEANEQLHGVPVVSSSLLCRPADALVLGGASTEPGGSGEWEGVTLCEVHYERTGDDRWRSHIERSMQLPIVYHDSSPLQGDADSWCQELRGLNGSVGAAQYAAKERGSAKVADEVFALALSGIDPSNFYLNRCEKAVTCIKGTMSTLDTGLLEPAIKALKEIEASQRAIKISDSIKYTAQPPTAEPCAIKPLLVDRGSETQKVSRFLDSTSDKRVLLVNGIKGIGRKSILNHARDSITESSAWLDVRCVENSPLAEFFGHFLLALGEDIKARPDLGPELYARLTELLVSSKSSVVVIHDAENLPLYADNVGHAELLEFLSHICRSEQAQSIRLLLVSAIRGALRGFAGSHRFDELWVRGLPDPDTVRLLFDLITFQRPNDSRPSAMELEIVAQRIHGIPAVAEIVTSLLKDVPVQELIEGLHDLPEVRAYIGSELLGKRVISDQESLFLKYASLFKIPVTMEAFANAIGARARGLIDELRRRLVIMDVGDRIIVHPLVADHFRARVAPEEEQRLHGFAFDYFEEFAIRRHLEIDQSVERVYHAMRAGRLIDMSELQLFTGPIRSALLEALRDREYEQLKVSSERILDVITGDPVATLALAISRDATGENVRLDEFSDALSDLGERELWVATELVRSRIRRRDFAAADEVLQILEKRFGGNSRVAVARAQLLERQGFQEEAVAVCEAVMKDRRSHPADVNSAALILRYAHRLDLFVEHVEREHDGVPERQTQRRLYGYACVVTNHAPNLGIEILARQYQAWPTDGRVIADYAGALDYLGRTVESQQIFTEALEDRSIKGRDRAHMLEEVALSHERAQDYKAANKTYRELLRRRRYDLHVYRRFARSLYEEAREAHHSNRHLIESECISEAISTLKNLLQIAPDDPWAVNFLETVERREFPKDGDDTGE